MASNSDEVRRAARRELARRELARRSASTQGEPEETSLGGFLRGLARGASDLYKGVTDLPALPFDLLTRGYNTANSIFWPNGYEVTRNGEKVRVSGMLPTMSEQRDAALSSIGVTEPRGGVEEAISAGTRSLGGAALSLGAGGLLRGASNATARGVGEMLSAAPKTQLVSAATGAVSSDIARQAGFGPIGQLGFGLAGSTIPMLGSGASALVRGVFRGGESGRRRVEENLDTFTRAGTTPSVGQATERRSNRALETMLARTPGSAGIMSDAAERQAEDISENLDDLARNLAGRDASIEQTGRAVIKSIRGEGGFVDQFKNTQRQLYDKLDEFIAPSTRVNVLNTKSALEDLTDIIPGAPRTSQYFINQRIAGIKSALEADTTGFSSVSANPEHQALFVGREISAEDAALFGDVLADGKLPYEALKKLRTLVGNEIADAGITSDVPMSKWKRLYAALSSDLRDSVADKPDAIQAWNRANNFTSAGMARIDVLEPIVAVGKAEDAFKAAMAGTKEGASTLRAVMQSTDDAGRKLITSSVLRRLGLARAGVQNELGDQFSSETFLTNWNHLSDEAKQTLFGRYGDDFRKSMDAVAVLAANLRKGSKVFQNPSGTSQAASQSAAITAFVMSLLTGHPYIAGSIATGVGGANLSAKLMTNPDFVRFLAGRTQAPAALPPAVINQTLQAQQ
jgi:hypothetical protein